MTRRNDPDLVARVQRMRATGASYREVAQATGVSESTVRNWTKGAPPVGAAQPPPPPGEPRALPDALAALAVELDSADAHAEADVCRRAADALRARPEAPPAVIDTEGIAEDDMRGFIGAVIKFTQQQIVDFAESGNQALVTRGLATIEKLARLDKQLRALEPQESDAVTVTAAELTAARQTFAERLETLAAQPMVCGECGAKLRMHAALGAAGVEQGE